MICNNTPRLNAEAPAQTSVVVISTAEIQIELPELDAVLSVGAAFIDGCCSGNEKDFLPSSLETVIAVMNKLRGRVQANIGITHPAC